MLFHDVGHQGPFVGADDVGGVTRHRLRGWLRGFRHGDAGVLGQQLGKEDAGELLGVVAVGEQRDRHGLTSGTTWHDLEVGGLSERLAVVTEHRAAPVAEHPPEPDRRARAPGLGDGDLGGSHRP